LRRRGPLGARPRVALAGGTTRRPLGVPAFLVALGPVALAVRYSPGFGAVNPLVSLLSIPGPLPFEWLGLAAFVVLFVMAATSHDFWQKTLAPSTWKWLHMLVYPAYALLVLHVLFGALRSGPHPLYPILLGLGFVTVAGLHLAVGLRERRRDERTTRPPRSGSR